MTTSPTDPSGESVPPSEGAAEPADIWTIGHGTLPADDFALLLHDFDIQELVDVRSFPGSRHNPQYGREEMERWLPDRGIDYRWMVELGGRRKAVADSKHVALRHVSFRAYADYMETPEFLTGVDDLLCLAAERRVAFMCSESVWWRCHRRLLADHLTLVRGSRVEHLMHDGRCTLHPPTEGVRLDEDQHRLVYDVGATPELV
ncbi:MAG: DUF488 domain-containing protein [Aquihabitans sp.]